MLMLPSIKLSQTLIHVCHGYYWCFFSNLNLPALKFLNRLFARSFYELPLMGTFPSSARSLLNKFYDELAMLFL